MKKKYLGPNLLKLRVEDKHAASFQDVKNVFSPSLSDLNKAHWPHLSKERKIREFKNPFLIFQVKF